MFFVSENNLSYPNWKVVGSININHDFYSQLNLVLHFFKCIAKKQEPDSLHFKTTQTGFTLDSQAFYQAICAKQDTVL